MLQRDTSHVGRLVDLFRNCQLRRLYFFRALHRPRRALLVEIQFWRSALSFVGFPLHDLVDKYSVHRLLASPLSSLRVDRNFDFLLHLVQNLFKFGGVFNFWRIATFVVLARLNCVCFGIGDMYDSKRYILINLIQV